MPARTGLILASISADSTARVHSSSVAGVKASIVEPLLPFFPFGKPTNQMLHLQAMGAVMTGKLKVLVSEYKKDDKATATMLAFNRQAVEAADTSEQPSLK